MDLSAALFERFGDLEVENSIFIYFVSNVQSLAENRYISGKGDFLFTTAANIKNHIIRLYI